MAGYVPDRGDFVWIDLNPRQEREQRVLCRLLGNSLRISRTL